MTLDDVEKRVGRDKSHISKIELGAYIPSIETKVDLAGAIPGLRLSELVNAADRRFITRAHAMLHGSLTV